MKEMYQSGLVLLRTVLVVSLAFFVVSCTVIVDPARQQCETHDDCKSVSVRGNDIALKCSDIGVCEEAVPCSTSADCPLGLLCTGEICAKEDPVWGCAGQRVAVEESGRIILPLVYLTGAPAVGVKASLCGALDSECETEVDSITTGDKGLVLMEVPGGFRGYVKITGDNILPSLYYLPELQGAELSLPPYFLPSSDNADALDETLGIVANPDTGAIVVQVQDCLGNFAGGVQYSYVADEKHADVAGYYYAGSPVTDLMATVDEVGIGGFANFPSGASTVTATLLETEQTVATLSLQVRADTITYVLVLP